MDVFIVISSDNRLHYLVDGILQCCPLNPDVETAISTGKIEKLEDGGFQYEYTIRKSTSEVKVARSFQDLLTNQLAQIRQVYRLAPLDLINVFYLDNPLTPEDYEVSNAWIEGIDRVYSKGKGHISNFRLFRVIFSYNVEDPTNVYKQVNESILRDLINKYKNLSLQESYANYLFYIDNQKYGGAAICWSKEDHDFIMPRYLFDLMILASSTNDSYGVMDAIHGQTKVCRSFAMGYGESMYYYPDVEEYFRLADKRDLYDRYLNSEDEADLINDAEAMDIEHHPMGLNKRLSRLSAIYDDVKFEEDVSLREVSADKIIDDMIVLLKEDIEKEREDELIQFKLNSPDIEFLQSEIVKNKETLSIMVKDEEETEDEFIARRQYLSDEITSFEERIKDIVASFVPKCPSFISRNEICLAGVDRDLKELTGEDDEFSELVAKYKNLISFICSADFNKMFISDAGTKTNKEAEKPASVEIVKDEQPKAKKGCLLSWLPWFKKSKENTHDKEVLTDASESRPVFDKGKILDCKKTIQYNLKLKNQFKQFSKDVDEVKNVFDDLKAKCNNFRLKIHSNLCFEWIDLDDLKKVQSDSFSGRLEPILGKWNENAPENRTKSVLDKLVCDCSSKFTKDKYQFVDLENKEPIPFVKGISASNLPDILNTLCRIAQPFANYNEYEGLRKHNVVYRVYSDKYEFENDFDEVRDKLELSVELLPYKSSHIASKICVMEFLPLDEDIVEDLVDLQQEDEEQAE